MDAGYQISWKPVRANPETNFLIPHKEKTMKIQTTPIIRGEIREQKRAAKRAKVAEKVAERDYSAIEREEKKRAEMERRQARRKEKEWLQSETF